MKRLGGVWPAVVDFANLHLAWRKARRGKSNRPDVLAFALDLEHELLALQHELATGGYRPGAYRLFTIYERKPRQIASAPFRDRVVHHAILNRIEPALDRRFIFDSYACRIGKGAHRAVDRYQGWARRHTYVLKMDVRQYFPSIDHGLLLQKLTHRIKDGRLLDLLRLIVAGGPALTQAGTAAGPARCCGIPIGNLTSQFFANLYLDDFDHWMKQTVRASAYLRYVDDMVVLADDSGWLRDLRDRVRERLALDRLVLHPAKAEISRTADGLDLLGYRVFPDFRRLRNDNGHRFARRLRAMAQHYAAGEMTWREVDARVQSWIGHASNADTLGLRRAIFARTVFQRGRAGRPPVGDPGRFLEQQTAQRALGQPQQEHARQPEQQLGLPPRPGYPPAP